MATSESKEVTLEKIVALCKRRGFIFQSSEIYGGLASTYDYGHYGVLLKNNVKAEWWRAVLQERDDMVALDAAILMHPKTWEASGHLEGFTDPLVQCLGECKKRWREDDLRDRAARRRGRRGRDPLPGLRRRALRAAPVQPHVRDLDGPVGGDGNEGLPATGDRSGDLRQLQERPPVRSQEATFRDRPDRQGLPQRDHPGELRLPYPRVRADGDRVLRPARTRRPSGTSAGWRSGCAGTPTSGSAPTTFSSASTARTSSPTTRPPPRTSSTCSRWAGRSWRGSPTAPTST